MGPRGGDEFNLVRKGENYGWPKVSEGRHYGGTPIPAHSTDPKFIPPKVSWTPVISPAGLVIYFGDLFQAWKGSALIGGLSSEALVRVAIDGESAREAERFEMGSRIRAEDQGPGGGVSRLEADAGARRR